MDPQAELLERVQHLEATVAHLEAVVARITLEVPFVGPSEQDVVVPASVADVAHAVEAHAVDLNDDADIERTTRPIAAAHDDVDLETRLGTYWLGRGGIALLITGASFYITVHFGDLGPFARVLLGYVMAAALSAFGIWLARRWRLFGELICGGGLAIAYLVTYALHFVPAVRVIDSQGFALVLLAASVLAIVAAAQRLQSETVAGIALFLGLHASVLAATTTFSLAAVSLLALGAFYFVLRNRWVIVPLSCLVGVYSIHAWWVVQHTSSSPGLVDTVLSGIGFLTLTFALFHIVVLVRPTALSARVGVAFTLLNSIGFVSLGMWEVHEATDGMARMVWTFMFLALTTAAMAGSAWVAARRNAEVLLQALFSTALVTSAVAAWVSFSGATFVLGLAAIAACGLWLWPRAMTVRVVGLALLVIAGIAVVSGEPHPIVSAIVTAAFVAAVRSPRRASLAADAPLGPLSLGFDVVCALGAAGTLARLISTLVPSTLTTLGWAIAAVLTVAIGLALRVRALRFAGFGLLAISIGRLAIRDLHGSGDQRIVTFLLLGVFLLALSFAYTRFREQVDRWL